tara:strand:+ start:310 stop:2136 length:1827 start_codon:yes stop_codon:yes gene_type:complete
MAKEVIINLEAKTDEAIKGIQETKKEIKNLNKEVTKGNKNTVSGLKDVEASSSATAGGVKKIGGAFKALGIGLIIAAFAKFTEVLNENQKVTDFFNTTFEVLSLAFNDFFNFIFDNVGGVVDSFKSIFDDPVQSIFDFGKAIRDNIVERFTSMLEAVGFVGEALVKVFKGDFAGAAESAKNAGKELFDVVTGVDDSFDKTVETVGKVAEATKNYVTETIKAGQANVELNKQAEIARVKNQGLIEGFDLQAEKLRQVRDEERNTVEERIKANDELKAVLEEQEKLMLANADAILKAAEEQFKKNDNDANAIALQEAKNERAAVEAQIAGFMSEQKSNDLALDRELIELTNSKLESEANLGIERKRINASKIEDDLKRLEREKEIDLEEATIQRNRLQRIVDEANEGTQAKVDAQIALDEFEVEMSQKKLDRDKEILDAEKEISDAKIKIAEEERNAKETALNGYASALSSISGIIGQDTQKGKALAIASSLVNTYAAIAGQLKAFAGVPVPGYAIAQAIATGLVGLANVKKIASVKVPESYGGSSSQTGSISAASAAPSFNIVGSDPQTQLAEAIGQQAQKPVKAFVVAGDVSTAQSLDRNIIQESSLG